MDEKPAATLRPMAERYRRPDWVRRVNAMADSVGGEARRIVPLDGPALVAEAEHSLDGEVASGSSASSGSFGDPEWRARFTALVSALDAAPMHVVGRLMTRQELLRGLRTRLLLTREVAAHPRIAEERVAAPVVITGPARSGTTILFELLALDPELRAPLACEGIHPLPRRAPGDRGERHAWSECEQELWADVQPEFAAIHELRSDLPVECVTLTIPSFAGSHWLMVAQLAGWSPDIEVMYDFHRRLLQVMQHDEEPRSWLLKTPGHLMTLESLFATYPDAWIVQTHRDPAKAMPSTVSTTAMVQWLRTDHVDVAPLAGAIEMAFSWALNHTVELRTSGPFTDRFVDVHFDRLMRDPVEAVSRAYAAMGRELGREHAERIRAYLRDKPKGKFGVHRYAPEDWGFTAESLRADLAPYIAHFGVALED
ncbi:MAG: sulfotransferase [Deltaproteobacteria bacterium]|nr:sulfotransferase [Deltaproteobacteria bacterium]